MNSSKNMFRLAQLVCRATTRNASTLEVPSPRFSRMKSKQSVIGVEDGVLVHVKTGFLDRVLFVTTTVLVTYGTTTGLFGIYRLLTK